MTRKEFELKLVEVGVFKNKKESAEKFELILNAITDEVVNGEGLNFLGFGKLEAVPTVERIARNPKTGEEVTIPAGRRIKFTASKNLKEKL